MNSSILNMNSISEIIYNIEKSEAEILKEQYPHYNYVILKDNDNKIGDTKLLVDKNVNLKDLYIKYGELVILHPRNKKIQIKVNKNNIINDLFNKYNKFGILYLKMVNKQTLISLFKNFLKKNE
jgi:hypothetical protein